MNQRYTIEVTDECVEITGTLTIREAFDYLSFFDQQGYTTLEDWGEKTTLYLRKRDLERERKDEIIKNSVEDLEDFKNRFHDEADKNEVLKNKIKELELLIKELMTEESLKRNKIRAQKELLCKLESQVKLRENPIVKFMLADMETMNEES